MKTRIVQNEPNDPASGEASVTPTGQTAEMTGSSATTPTNGFRAFVRRRELVIFFALSYLIAWSTLPFGSFLAFAPLVSAIVVVLIAEGLPGLARLGRRVIRWRVNWIWYAAAIGAAAAGPRGGDRSEHGGGRTCTLRGPVPAVVRGAVAVRPPNGQFHRWAAGGGAGLARLCAAAAAIEVVTVGVSATARSC